MTEESIHGLDSSQFTNGDDIHFDYNPDTKNIDSNSTLIGSNTKKKKKKKKNKSRISPANVEVTLNDPDEEYPNSRVIKQAPNGDVVVERLPEENESYGQPHRHQYTVNIWDNASLEEQEKLRNFWESLDQESKIKLVRIDKKSIMEIFRNEAKLASVQNHNNSGQASSISNSCQCKYCGKKNSIIEDELENIYDNHFDDIIDFIHEIRDINDLNALPSLLFGGFHMLEDEHKLQKRQKKAKIAPIEEVERDSVPTGVDPYVEKEFKEIEAEIAEIKEDFEHEFGNGKSNQERRSNIFNKLKESQAFISNDILDEDQLSEIRSQFEVLKSGDVAKSEVAINKLLSSDFMEGLKALKRGNEGLKNDTPEIGSGSSDEKNIAKDISEKMYQADKSQLEKGLMLLRQHELNPEEDLDTLTKKFDVLFSKGLMALTEDLLNNDGSSFINMMEALKKARNTREELLKTGNVDYNVSDDEDVPYETHDEEKLYNLNNLQVDQLQRDLKKMEIEKNENRLNVEMVDESEDYASPNKLYPLSLQGDQKISEFKDFNIQNSHTRDREFTEARKNSIDEDKVLSQIEIEEEQDEYEANDDLSDTESEISEEEKMQEIRRLFLIQVIKLFQERLQCAYKEMLSHERTQKLIEELEAEENAKKERELKKLKQKEKAKEKKRLQQLAKEEERRKKEEQEKAKEEELRQKQEALKAEQKRKKEEAKKKREEEKKKRIEELKRKEEEQKRKAEAQRKKEEAARKLKEEKRRQVELERKAKEEAEKRRKEEENLGRLEKDKDNETQNATSTRDETLFQANTSVLGAFPEITKDFEEPPISAPNVELGSNIIDEPLNSNNEAKETATMSPGTNPILDKLYQTRSSSLSNGANSPNLIPPQTQLLTSVLAPGPNQISNHMIGATDIKGSPPGGTINSPWNTATKSRPPVSIPNQFQQPFSPFNQFQSENSNLGGLSNNMWGASQNRSNSIWGATNSSNGGIWNNPINNIAPIVLDNEAVQVAAFNAFQILQNSNQLEFGLAPSLKHYQSTKSLMGSTSLTYNQFLGACQSSAVYIFEFLYDDFGTVTHIKVSASPQYQPIATPSHLSGSTMLSGHENERIVSPSLSGRVSSNAHMQSLNAKPDSQSVLQSLEESSRTPLNGRTLWN